jgi:hypothetical protein
VKVRDTLGNTASMTVNITNIDTTLPNCGTRSYAPTTSTNGNVVATLTGSTDNESGIATAGGTCILTNNATTCNVQISDNAGNTRTCTSNTVNNIDRAPPTATVNYSLT